MMLRDATFAKTSVNVSTLIITCRSSEMHIQGAFTWTYMYDSRD